jgi:hypothetical protein
LIVIPWKWLILGIGASRGPESGSQERYSATATARSIASRRALDPPCL